MGTGEQLGFDLEQAFLTPNQAAYRLYMNHKFSQAIRMRQPNELSLPSGNARPCGHSLNNAAIPYTMTCLHLLFH